MSNDQRFVEIANLAKTCPDPCGTDAIIVEEFNLILRCGAAMSLIGHSECGESDGSTAPSAGDADSVLLYLPSRQFPRVNVVEVPECDGEYHAEGETATSFRIVRQSATESLPEPNAVPVIENRRQVAAGNMADVGRPQLLKSADYLLPPAIESAATRPTCHGTLLIAVVAFLFLNF